MRKLELQNFGVVEMSTEEKITIHGGGGFWWEVAKACGVEAAISTMKYLGKAMIDDYKSRPGTPRSMSDTYASNPYH